MTGPSRDLETRIGRLLTAGTFLSLALIGIGLVLLVASGRSPLDAAPALDLARIPGDVAALQPAGFLWPGLLLVLVTPSARVAAAMIGYFRAGERDMAAVSVLILIVIAVGVATGMLEG